MFFETVTQIEKPSSAPSRVTVYITGDDEFVFCPIRNKLYKVNNKPEEKVRQWWIYRLRDIYGYRFDQISVEVPVKVGSAESKKSADIVVYKNSDKITPIIFIEVKKPSRKDGVDQLQTYMNATGCRLGVWSNGSPPHVYLLRIEAVGDQLEPSWRELRNIPGSSETLSDVDSPITRKNLEPVTDFLSIFRECEDHIKAHEGINVFDEIFKLIFAKIFDERRNLKNDNSPAQFRIGALEDENIASNRIKNLFKLAREQWIGVFNPNEEILLGNKTLSFCASSLQKAYLLKSDADILGSAFEVMINPTMKGDKGQYFTPRHVVDMCISVLDPKEHETILDPACGSGGFLVSAMDYVFKNIANERDDESEILENQKDFASNNVFGMDYDPIIAKVAKAYMLIWGDGRSNIFIGDGLNNNQWSNEAKAKLLSFNSKNELENRKFDIIATNPPFGGDISVDDTLSQYRLAFKINSTGRSQRIKKVSRDILFLERCLDSLSSGGKMAIVLPRGIFKNYTDERIRRFLIERAEIKAVVSLTGEMFKPFTNTKTCVLFIKKRDKILSDIKEAKLDYPVVYVVSEKPGKDRSGRLVRDESGNIVSDFGEIESILKKRIIW